MIISVEEGVEYTSEKTNYTVDTELLNTADPTQAKAKNLLEDPENERFGWYHNRLSEIIDHAIVPSPEDVDQSVEVKC